MNQKIYKIQIQMTSQNDCDRMKQICEDYGLPIWDYPNAFDMFEYNDIPYFSYETHLGTGYFAIWFVEDLSEIEHKEPITIEQFLELLNEK